jgi:hypothetical protein
MRCKNHDSIKQFALDMLACIEDDDTYLNRLFSDEATFHICRVWGTENPHFVTEHEHDSAVIAQSVQRWATGWTIGVLGFDSRRGRGLFLFSTGSNAARGPTQSPIQWVPWVLSLGVKRPGRASDHSPPSSTKIK